MTRRITITVEVDDDSKLTGPLLKMIVEDLPEYGAGVERVHVLEWQE